MHWCLKLYNSAVSGSEDLQNKQTNKNEKNSNSEWLEKQNKTTKKKTPGDPLFACKCPWIADGFIFHPWWVNYRGPSIPDLRPVK